jgi:N-acetylglucosaminyldiphosphoundecaprenol N-acetyl-beta-D-mannosaminyltransferase
MSDLCTADGIAVVWLARLLGIPIKHRIAGADFLEAFRNGDDGSPPLKLYLFGGAEGIAEAAAKAINARSSRVRCVGWHYPGFGSAADMSAPETLDVINASGADLILASLGADKGQSWLISNHDKLRVPLRAHVGAAMNFEAGVLKRAPLAFQKGGLEWLWRIKEEPYLWRRYWKDGRTLVWLLAKQVLPLLIWRTWDRLLGHHRAGAADVALVQTDRSVTVRILGPATDRQIPQISAALRQALAANLTITVDLSGTANVDARFLGLVLALRKATATRLYGIRLEGLSPKLQRLFRLHGVEFDPSSTVPIAK